MRAGQKQFIENGQAYHLEFVGKTHICAFFWRESPKLSPDSQKGSMSPNASEPGLTHRVTLEDRICTPRFPGNSGHHRENAGVLLTVSQVAGAQLSRFQVKRDQCKWSDAGIHSGGRRAVLSWAQKQKDAAVRPPCALRSGFPRPRPNSPAPPCSSLCPGPGFCPGWSPPGLNRFALWSLSPLHPRPAPLLASASASLVFSPMHLSQSLCVSGFPVMFWVYRPVLHVSLTTAVPSLSLDI